MERLMLMTMDGRRKQKMLGNKELKGGEVRKIK